MAAEDDTTGDVMGETSANISTPRECARECSSTFRGEHGAALPGGPFPGTHGGPGEVRRCEHGRVWEWTGGPWTVPLALDHWRSLSAFWEPIKYRRAVRVITTRQET